MTELLEISVGIAVALLTGRMVEWLFRLAGTRLERPEEIGENVWNALQPAGIEEPGRWLGRLERLVSLAAAWTSSYGLIAGWLAFKVASKWEVWSNVLRVPTSLPDISDLEFLRARRIWGSRMMMRFLTGTLANVLLGFVAAYIGQHTWDAIQAFCPK